VGLVLFMLVVVGFAGAAVWLWLRALAGRRWWRSAGWFTGTAILLVLGTGGVYLVGALAGASLDPEEACHAEGQRYDAEYRRANLDDYGQWFPLHDKCHAGYDLVPIWVNPALVALPVLAVACLASAVWCRSHSGDGTP
jgi:hypothetical protein